MAFITSAPTVLTSGLSQICRTKSLSHACERTLSNTKVMPSGSGRRATATMSARKFFVGGNWKCNLTKAAISELVSAFNEGPELDPSLIEVAIAPPTVYLDSTRSMLRKDFATCAQNAWISEGGAYTGEIDAKMAADVGAAWVLLGHSERRHLPELHESNKTVAEKAKYALTETDLGIIYCIGELPEEREANETDAVCERQLEVLSREISDWSKVVIAYEPVWAIGTGKVATPDQAEEVHNFLRTWLANNVSQKVANETRILYGGSVSPDNCEELAKKPNIDGFLVGGASLKPSFNDIIQSYKVALAGAV